jgi:hypothetical protein
MTKQEADQAMAWLRVAVAKGYRDTTSIAKNKDLDVLRDRDEFKKVISELESSKTTDKK